MTESTRFKLAIGILAMYFVQGIIKAFVPSFPLIEVISAEGAVAGFYFTVRTVQDVKQAGLDNKLMVSESKNPCPEPKP